MTGHLQPSQSDSRKIMFKILFGSLLLFAILEAGVIWLAAQIDQTWAAIIATGVMLYMALLLEKSLFGFGPRKAVRTLGYGRWNPRAVLVAAIIAIGMQLFYPIFILATGAQITLKDNWLWILLGAIVLNGLGEETLFLSVVTIPSGHQPYCMLQSKPSAYWTSRSPTM